MTLADFLTQAPIVTDAHDSGVRALAAVSARLAYVSMSLTLCWGVLTATGWVRRVTGHQALRSGHMMLASFTLATGLVHAVAFQLLDNQVLTISQTLIPFLAGGYLRWGLGVLSLELMIAIAITAGMHRLFRYRNWLRFHQLAYLAVASGGIHAWLGSMANGDFATLWLGAITVAAPAVTLTALRFIPPRVFVNLGLLDNGSLESLAKIDKHAPLELSVDNMRCHRFGFCQSEAPTVFKLLEDGRLQYKHHPDVEDNADIRSAARACPMQAIQVRAEAEKQPS
jgi:ferredoxin